MKLKLNIAVFLLLLIFAVSGIARATEWVTVTNKSGGTIRVKVWRGLNAKVGVSWKRNNTKSYSVRVFRKEGRFVKCGRRSGHARGSTTAPTSSSPPSSRSARPSPGIWSGCPGMIDDSILSVGAWLTWLR